MVIYVDWMICFSTCPWGSPAENGNGSSCPVSSRCLPNMVVEDTPGNFPDIPRYSYTILGKKDESADNQHESIKPYQATIHKSLSLRVLSFLQWTAPSRTAFSLCLTLPKIFKMLLICGTHVMSCYVMLCQVMSWRWTTTGTKNMIETCRISSSGFFTQAPNDVSNGQRHEESTGTSRFHWTLHGDISCNQLSH